jgi:hypothetical protein
MNSDERHVYGPRPVGALIPRLTRVAFRRRAPATAQVLADWASIIGPALAAVTTPRRLSAGTLTIACAGPIAMELQHLSDQVIGRINTHFGTQVVRALRFEQTFQPAPAPPPVRPTPDPMQVARLDAKLGDLPDGELRGALASLGRTMLAFSNRPRSR